MPESRRLISNFPRCLAHPPIPPHPIWRALPLSLHDTIDAVAPVQTPKLEYLLTETRGRVAVVTLHRPKALNALCNGLFVELNQVLKEYDNNSEIGAIVLTGSERAFAGKETPKDVCFCGGVDKLPSENKKASLIELTTCAIS